jgi:hypothetical protein
MSRSAADVLVVLRDGGDLATGAAWRLKRAGFGVAVCELDWPLTLPALRRLLDRRDRWLGDRGGDQGGSRDGHRSGQPGPV